VNLSAERIAQATQGVVLRGPADTAFTSVSTDSRTAAPGDLFVALAGERFDGHDYVADAVSRGCRGAVVRRDRGIDLNDRDVVLIGVDDTTEALTRWARETRHSIAVPVVGITGSNGKTTTKEFAAAILGTDTLKAEASFNNVLGVSRTLLRFEPHHRYVVLELGTNHPGEIASLVDLATPDVGVLLNVTASHTEFFGDEKGVLREKSELPLATDRSILNADDPLVAALVPRCRHPLTFGSSTGADVRGTDITLDSQAIPSFELSILGGSPMRVQLSTPGSHNVSNALAAAAIGTLMNVDADAICARLRDARPPKMRMERVEVRGVVVYNDAYNANPASVRAAWAFMRALGASGRKWIVLGEMLELGEESPSLHERVASELTPDACDVFVPMGPHADAMAQAAHGSRIHAILRCSSSEDVASAIQDGTEPGDVVLLKASRGVKLESILQSLTAQER